MEIDYHEINASERYKLMAQSVVPRPIAWIVSENENGTFNIAPFSYFTPLSSYPPTLIVSVGHRPDGTPKDTLANLRRSGRCTLCLAAPEQVEPMHFSSKALAAGESEAERFGIVLTEGREGFPFRIDGSPTAFYCRLHSEVPLEGSKTIPLILEIEGQYLDERCILDEERLHLDCDLLARVGPEYRKLGERIPAPEIPE
jgi:flavin reductase (DIM6/NTAB) family NADH-FMN oxidoreductase RutF